MMSTTKIAFEVKTELAFDEAVNRCREALAAEGFGVLSEIDIRATLKKKLDVDPCNVTVSVESGQTVVRAMNPESVMGLLDESGIEQLAAEIGNALRRALAAVG